MIHLITGHTCHKLLVIASLILLSIVDTSAQRSTADSLRQALSFARTDATRAKILQQLVREYTFVQPDTALPYSEAFLAISQKLDDTTYLMQSLKALGTVYAIKADYASSLDYLFQALDLAQQTGNRTQSFALLMNIGNVTKGQEDLDRSKRYYEQALAIGNQLQDTAKLISASINIGAVLLDQKEYQHSVRYNRRAVDWIENKNRLRHQLGPALTNIGSAEEALGNHTSALKYLKRGLKVTQSAGDELTETVILHDLAEMYVHIDQLDSALLYGETALRKAQAASFTKEKSDAYSLLSEILESLGNYQQALQYHKRHLALEDSIFNQTSAQQIAELQTQYETAQKEQQIVALTQERALQELRAEKMTQRQLGLVLGSALLLALLGVTFSRYWLKRQALGTIRNQKQAIEAKNAENELLIREIHHRVKNNLQVIMSLLNTQANVLGNSPASEVITESQNRVKSMALIHEKLYQSKSFTLVPAQPYLSEMAHNVTQSYRQQARLDLHVESIEISMSVAVPLGLIVNELLTNAFKYAFRNTSDPHLSVIFRTEGMNGSRHYHLQIADNGKGLPPDFDPGRSRSFGLKLVKGLTHQLGGELTVHSTSGACFSIRFKEVVATEQTPESYG